MRVPDFLLVMNKDQSITSSRKNSLFIILTAVFLTNALIAEIIGVKIFSLEKIFDLPPARISFLGDSILDFNLTAGVLIWPVVFVTTDLVNEYFGKEAVKKISYLASILILYAFVAIWIATTLPPAEFWVEVNKIDAEGRAFDINYSYNRIFQQGLSIILGSITAFLLSQILDAYVFHYLRKKTGNKLLWLRATGSTVVSQFIDSFVVLFIAFYLLADQGKWTIGQVISVGLLNYIYKFLVAVILTPLLYILHNGIDKYLGSKDSQKLQDIAKA